MNNDMKAGTLVRLAVGKSYTTITVRSNDLDSDMADTFRSKTFTITDDMIGMCIEPHRIRGSGAPRWASGKYLFDDNIIWVGKGIVEPLENIG